MTMTVSPPRLATKSPGTLYVLPPLLVDTAVEIEVGILLVVVPVVVTDDAVEVVSFGTSVFIRDIDPP